MKIDLNSIEKQVSDCKSLNELNDLSRIIQKKFDNLNYLVKNKRIELTPTAIKKVDRKQVLRDLNKMVERHN